MNTTTTVRNVQQKIWLLRKSFDEYLDELDPHGDVSRALREEKRSNKVGQQGTNERNSRIIE